MDDLIELSRCPYEVDKIFSLKEKEIKAQR